MLRKRGLIALVIIGVFIWLTYDSIQKNDDPHETMKVAGTLKRVGSSGGSHLCFIQLDNGDAIIQRCEKETWLINVPINLEKVVYYSGEVKYRIIE